MKRFTDKIERKVNYNGQPHVLSVELGYGYDYSDRGKGKTVIYVSNMDPEDYGLMNRPDYSIKGEDTELDKAWRKYNKIEKQIMKDAIQLATSEIDEVFTQMLGASIPGCIEDLLPSLPSLKWEWSQYAGCSCPCSPGWVLKRGTSTVRLARKYHVSCFVSLKTVESIEREAKEQVKSLKQKIDKEYSGLEKFEQDLRAKLEQDIQKALDKKHNEIGKLQKRLATLTNKEEVSDE